MYDYIIVGSGASGSVIAHKLTEAGARCVMLEAGKHFTADTFPDDELGGNAELYWNGGIELNTDSNLAFLRARCVGGTTIVNQCLLDRFDDLAWADWKSESGVSFFTPDEMAPHYEAVGRHLSIKTLPENLRNGNARAMVRGFEKLGLRYAPMERGQTDCNTGAGNDCIACLNGCRLDSKQSMLVTFLREALAAGLELRPEFQVDTILAPGGLIRVRGVGPAGPEEITGRRLVLAAGVFGNVQILLRSGFGEKLPAIGAGFSSHPQSMHFGLFREPVDAHKGSFQTVKSKDPGIRRRGFKLENVFAGPIALAMLVPGLGAEHQEMMRRYRHMACMEVAVRDENNGKVRINSKGRVRVEKRLTRQDQARAADGEQLIDDIMRAAGAYDVLHTRFWFGVHLMGGCAIGRDPRRSVVNEGFSLHTQRDIYIADSSAFVNAPGINPSLTIMAISNRAAETMLKEAS